MNCTSAAECTQDNSKCTADKASSMAHPINMQVLVVLILVYTTATGLDIWQSLKVGGCATECRGKAVLAQATFLPACVMVEVT